MDSLSNLVAQASSEFALIQPIVAPCLECRSMFQTTRVKNIRSGQMEQVDVFCPPHRKPDPQSAPVKRDFEAEWLKICHGQFTDTVVERIPECLRARFRKYQFSNLGIFAVGPKGTFKSRTMHLLMRQLHYRGHRVKILSGIRLGIAIAESFENGGYSALLDSMTTIEALYLDDFDKIRLTPRVEEGVFAILDERLNRRLPCFFTANVVGIDIEKLYSQNIGGPLRRRISEGCIPVNTFSILRDNGLWDDANNKPVEVRI
jgi:hypothetical protein